MKEPIRYGDGTPMSARAEEWAMAFVGAGMKVGLFIGFLSGSLLTWLLMR